MVLLKWNYWNDYELIYCSSKTTFSKLNEQYEISLRSVKNYSDEICLEQLRSIKSSDYSTQVILV